MQSGNRFFLVILTGLLLSPAGYAQQQDATSTPAPPVADATAPALKEASKPLYVPGDVEAGYLIKHVDPTYPKEARKKRMTGTVVLHAVIDEQGDITDLQVISSPNQIFTDACVQAIQQWKYKPYLLKGTPTKVDSTITVQFSGH
jgi:protein TonB